MPWADDLTDLANERAYQIVENFDHIGLWQQGLGEIIAEGYANPQRVINGWMGSKGHRDWIMGDDDTSVAVSCYVTDDNSFYHWVAIFHYDQSVQHT